VTSLERVSRTGLGALQQIGKGGQALVFLAPDLHVPGEQGSLVFKEYKAKNVSGVGLDRMTGLRLRLPDRDRQVLDLIANWPLRVVEGEDGRTAGVILQLIPPEFFHEVRSPTGRTKRVPRDGQTLSATQERLGRISVPFAGIGDRYRFCRDLAFAVGFLHRREVCIGDISFANVAVCFDLAPCVYLVDCDAFRLKGNAPVVPQLHTPDWIPPEGALVQSERTDLYKLGLFILRVLAPRPLGAQNCDPAWADRALDPRGRHMLRRALGRDATARPTARDWYAHFSAVLARRSLSTTPHRSRMPAPV
jgi:DNA-binding helix-hairpin-helix protein with protein kinase domain